MVLMSEIIGTIFLFFLLTFGFLRSSDQENRLKALSISSTLFLLLSFETITVEWARMTTDLVEEEEDPHYGLPDIWDGNQVVCVHFPPELAPERFNQGRKHIDKDGTQFMSDDDWNETGVCIGGFSGFNNGWALFNAAANSTETDFPINSTEYSFGIMVNSIAGVDPNSLTGDLDGAYWSLYHNGAFSIIGIRDLPLDSDSVITWRVDTW
ncbi:MAG TPA: DUF4430 domain-containing protein [Candidatus Thalassarchaeaceae archaeon]|nr:DUF4430 domain-containing protein [Candidatus Thalassarchaeaceae archaeon]